VPEDRSKQLWKRPFHPRESSIATFLFFRSRAV
jgi:hypothetical protein